MMLMMMTVMLLVVTMGDCHENNDDALEIKKASL
jgi:hypothetical protein